ncbi:hypothetical protein Salat_2494800 [Sesamum alatum]|uniref:Uncharacterized protein n=1 Tax=Sesamum alatum TaxID=300844 RepID=A0AAE1XRI9_9LAMI|nr:hypothetical protein Salat_2494800 [Sesamum alatum]
MTMVELSGLAQSKQIQEKGNESKLQKEEEGIRAKTPSDVVRGNTIMQKTHFSLIPDDIVQREGTSATRQDGQDGLPLNTHVYLNSWPEFTGPLVDVFNRTYVAKQYWMLLSSVGDDEYHG